MFQKQQCVPRQQIQDIWRKTLLLVVCGSNKLPLMGHRALQRYQDRFSYGKQWKALYLKRKVGHATSCIDSEVQPALNPAHDNFSNFSFPRWITNGSQSNLLQMLACVPREWKLFVIVSLLAFLLAFSSKHCGVYRTGDSCPLLSHLFHPCYLFLWVSSDTKGAWPWPEGIKRVLWCCNITVTLIPLKVSYQSVLSDPIPKYHWKRLLHCKNNKHIIVKGYGSSLFSLCVTVHAMKPSRLSSV